MWEKISLSLSLYVATGPTAATVAAKLMCVVAERLKRVFPLFMSFRLTNNILLFRNLQCVKFVNKKGQKNTSSKRQVVNKKILITPHQKYVYEI